MNYTDMTLHTDKYQINMMYAHWINGSFRKRAVFEVYFRTLPFYNGYAVFAGLERMVQYIQQLQFSDSDLEYLASQGEHYAPEFLDELRRFRFKGTIYSVREGALVFPNEPLLRVEGTIFETQFIETALLSFLNYQTLIATKASRIKRVAGSDTLLEFGSRRAPEADAAVWGARAAYVAGFDSTSNLLAGKWFGIPTSGTHAHSWVQCHDDEFEAFAKFAAALPNQVTLLVDTYDTLRSGLPQAIRLAKQLQQTGKRVASIRIDSGDIAYLSNQARMMLDQAGLTHVKIVASNDLDEETILHLKAQGAKVDSWGVGTKLITAEGHSSLGGIYKMVAYEDDGGKMQPKIKISSNPDKITTPGIKQVFRIIDRKNGKAVADYVCLSEETEIRQGVPLRLKHPAHPYMTRIVEDYIAEPLLASVFQEGRLVRMNPGLDEIRLFHQEQLGLFWPEYLRIKNPEVYPVYFSEEVWNLKQNMIHHIKHAIRQDGN